MQETHAGEHNTVIYFPQNISGYGVFSEITVGCFVDIMTSCTSLFLVLIH